MPIQFDPTNKWILITSPTTVTDALDLYRESMDWCDEQTSIGYDVPMSAAGKFDMGLGKYSDIIYQLINGWKLKFWSTTEHFVVTGTLLPETPALSRHVTPADIEYQVATQGIIVQPVISESEKLEIAGRVWDENRAVDVKEKTDHIPPDLAEVPTHPELIAQHGLGSWEGATPTQLWSHPERDLTTREIAGSPENIAGEATLDDIKGTTFQKDLDSLKKIREYLEKMKIREPPKHIAQYLEEGA